jgi:glutaredoxin-related protein
MADIDETEDAELDALLAEYGDEDESPEVTAAEEKADHEDEKARHQSVEAITRVEKLERDLKLRDLEDAFKDAATDDEKRILAVLRVGNETPEQLARAIQLAKTKAAELAPQVDENEVDKQARQKAAQIIGSGPIPVGEKEPERDPRQDLFEKVQTGDPLALVNLLGENSEFVAAVLNGQPIRKPA